MTPHGISYITAGFVHPSLTAQRRALGALGTLVRNPIIRVRGIHALTRLPAAAPRLCVGYFHHPGDQPAAVTSLSRFVRSGGSFLALHSVSASFKGNPEFEELLGGVFTVHPSIRQIVVEPANGAASASFTVVEEPYEHRLAHDVTVIRRWRSAESAEPGAHTVGDACAWIRTVGAGRIGYLSLGHRADSWSVPGVRVVLRELVEWCLSGARS